MVDEATLRDVVNVFADAVLWSSFISIALGFCGYWAAEAFHGLLDAIRRRGASRPFAERVAARKAMLQRVRAGLERIEAREARRG